MVNKYLKKVEILAAIKK